MSKRKTGRIAGATALLLSAALVLGSCLERKEKIVVHRDGSVDVTWQVAGDEADARNGLGLPTGRPWQIEHWLEKNGKDEERFHYRARAKFDDLRQLDAALVFSESDLEIDSSVEIKQSGGKTFYTFRRTYGARDWWRFARIKDRELDPKLVERVSKQPFNSLAPAEQQKLAQGLAQFEIKKRALITADGLGRALLESGFPSRLIEQCRAQVEQALGEVLTAGRVMRLLSLEGEPQQAETAAIERELEQAEQDTLTRAFESHTAVDWQGALAKAKSAFALSEDLTDESFKLDVELPGVVIVTNGERRGKGGVSFEFKGEDLMNRDVPLFAISVVE